MRSPHVLPRASVFQTAALHDTQPHLLLAPAAASEGGGDVGGKVVGTSVFFLMEVGDATGGIVGAAVVFGVGARVLGASVVGAEVLGSSLSSPKRFRSSPKNDQTMFQMSLTTRVLRR